MEFGNKILNLRKQKGLSQEELGEKIGVTRQTISNWELGETSPSLEQLKKISKVFNISIDELLDNDIKQILLEKTSNTERLAGLILKIAKIFLIGIPVVFGLIIIMAFLYKVIRNNRDTGREILESIYCKIYGEEHSYTITYEELTGRPIGQGGDVYFDDILDLDKYNNAHQIFNVINDYVKKNGGTCQMRQDKDLNDIVTMEIKEGTLSKTGVTVIIRESADYNITYGEEFHLEKYMAKNNYYKKMDMTGNNCGFNMIGYEVSPEEPLELKQNWSCIYGKLDKGTYRLVKNVSFQSDTLDSESDNFYIWTEFTID